MHQERSPRFIDLDAENFLLASTMNAVLVKELLEEFVVIARWITFPHRKSLKK
jgi:hypothetical protein